MALLPSIIQISLVVIIGRIILILETIKSFTCTPTCYSEEQQQSMITQLIEEKLLIKDEVPFIRRQSHTSRII